MSNPASRLKVDFASHEPPAETPELPGILDGPCFSHDNSSFDFSVGEMSFENTHYSAAADPKGNLLYDIFEQYLLGENPIREKLLNYLNYDGSFDSGSSDTPSLLESNHSLVDQESNRSVVNKGSSGSTSRRLINRGSSKVSGSEDSSEILSPKCDQIEMALMTIIKDALGMERGHYETCTDISPVEEIVTKSLRELPPRPTCGKELPQCVASPQYSVKHREGKLQGKKDNIQSVRPDVDTITVETTKPSKIQRKSSLIMTPLYSRSQRMTTKHQVRDVESKARVEKRSWFDGFRSQKAHQETETHLRRNHVKVPSLKAGTKSIDFIDASSVPSERQKSINSKNRNQQTLPVTSSEIEERESDGAPHSEIGIREENEEVSSEEQQLADFSSSMEYLKDPSKLDAALRRRLARLDRLLGSDIQAGKSSLGSSQKKAKSRNGDLKATVDRLLIEVFMKEELLEKMISENGGQSNLNLTGIGEKQHRFQENKPKSLKQQRDPVQKSVSNTDLATKVSLEENEIVFEECGVTDTVQIANEGQNQSLWGNQNLWETWTPVMSPAAVEILETPQNQSKFNGLVSNMPDPRSLSLFDKDETDDSTLMETPMAETQGKREPTRIDNARVQKILHTVSTPHHKGKISSSTGSTAKTIAERLNHRRVCYEAQSVHSKKEDCSRVDDILKIAIDTPKVTDHRVSSEQVKVENVIEKKEIIDKNGNTKSAGKRKNESNLNALVNVLARLTPSSRDPKKQPMTTADEIEQHRNQFSARRTKVEVSENDGLNVGHTQDQFKLTREQSTGSSHVVKLEANHPRHTMAAAEKIFENALESEHVYQPATTEAGKMPTDSNEQETEGKLIKERMASTTKGKVGLPKNMDAEFESNVKIIFEDGAEEFEMERETEYGSHLSPRGISTSGINNHLNTKPALFSLQPEQKAVLESNYDLKSPESKQPSECCMVSPFQKESEKKRKLSKERRAKVRNKVMTSKGKIFKPAVTIPQANLAETAESPLMHGCLYDSEGLKVSLQKACPNVVHNSNKTSLKTATNTDHGDNDNGMTKKVKVRRLRALKALDPIKKQFAKHGLESRCLATEHNNQSSTQERKQKTVKTDDSMEHNQSSGANISPRTNEESSLDRRHSTNDVTLKPAKEENDVEHEHFAAKRITSQASRHKKRLNSNPRIASLSANKSAMENVSFAVVPTQDADSVSQAQLAIPQSETSKVKNKSHQPAPFNNFLNECCLESQQEKKLQCDKSLRVRTNQEESSAAYLSHNMIKNSEDLQSEECSHNTTVRANSVTNLNSDRKVQERKVAMQVEEGQDVSTKSSGNKSRFSISTAKSRSGFNRGLKSIFQKNQEQQLPQRRERERKNRVVFREDIISDTPIESSKRERAPNAMSRNVSTHTTHEKSFECLIGLDPFEADEPEPLDPTMSNNRAEKIFRVLKAYAVAKQNRRQKTNCAQSDALGKVNDRTAADTCDSKVIIQDPNSGDTKLIVASRISVKRCEDDACKGDLETKLTNSTNAESDKSVSKKLNGKDTIYSGNLGVASFSSGKESKMTSVSGRTRLTLEEQRLAHRLANDLIILSRIEKNRKQLGDTRALSNIEDIEKSLKLLTSMKESIKKREQEKCKENQ